MYSIADNGKTATQQPSAMAATQNWKIYFAYGSNLSSTQMAQRCPDSIAMGMAWLPGWDWIINERHYANIVQVPASTGGKSGHAREYAGVYGLLYRLPPEDEATLDLCEGVPWAYQKVMLNVTALDGRGNEVEEVETLVYVDSHNVKPDAPKPEYVGRMSRGVKEAHEKWGFPVDFAEKVMKMYVPGLEW